MDQVIQLFFDGLALGSIYALVALGFVVIYRSSQVFNFAQGEFLVFGGMMFWWFTSKPPEPAEMDMMEMALAMDSMQPSPGGADDAWYPALPWGVGLVLAMVSTGLLGVITERVALRPLLGKPVFVTIIVTIFLGLILRTLMVLKFGVDPHPLPTAWEQTATVDMAGAKVNVKALVTIGAAAVALAGYFWVVKKTRLGVGMRATSSDQETALGLGIPVGRIFGLSWFIAGAFAALGGMFLGMYPRMGIDITTSFDALQAFQAVIIGGLDSAAGAVIAGLALGLSVVFAEVYLGKELLGNFGDGFHHVFPYLLMVAFLVLRPRGIFGTEKVERV